MHVPEARNREPARGVESAGICRRGNLTARSCRDDHAILNKNYAVFQRRGNGRVFQGGAYYGDLGNWSHSSRRRELCQRAKIRLYGSRDERGQVGFVRLAHRLKMIELSIGADQGNEILRIIYLQGLLSPNQAADGVAVRRTSADRKRSRRLDVHL